MFYKFYLAFRSKEMHFNVYQFGLALLVSCLPLSRYLLSISLFLLTINWIVEGNYRNKIAMLRQNPNILLFASIFLVYAVGLLFTENFQEGLARVKNALPLFMIPIVTGTSRPLSYRNTRRLLLLFSVAVAAASLVCIIIYLRNGIPAGGDFRQISVFMPHIRFALMIDMAIAIVLYYMMTGKPELPPVSRILLPAVALLLTGFLFLLRSASGIALFAAIIIIFIVYAGRKAPRPIRLVLIFLIAAGFISCCALVAITWFKNFHQVPGAPSESLTINGNPYTHDTLSGLLENGYPTDYYSSEYELQREWNKISPIQYDQFDHKGQAIRSTIKRYLTSKGLRKDSAGIHALKPADILKIEQGLANYKFSEEPGISQRLYETLYEIHVYKKTGFVELHSLGQRLIFLKVASELAVEHFPMGVGTGDVYDIMLSRVRAEQLTVDASWEGKPHNQYAFQLLAFGVMGFVWILFCWVYPVIRTRAYNLLLFNVFALIIFVSMFLLDTLESYDNMVFFAFFYSILVFSGKSFFNRYNEMCS